MNYRLVVDAEADDDFGFMKALVRMAKQMKQAIGDEGKPLPDSGDGYGLGWTITVSDWSVNRNMIDALDELNDLDEQ